jgi:hypothetical protein
MGKQNRVDENIKYPHRSLLTISRVSIPRFLPGYGWLCGFGFGREEVASYHSISERHDQNEGK